MRTIGEHKIQIPTSRLRGIPSKVEHYFGVDEAVMWDALKQVFANNEYTYGEAEKEPDFYVWIMNHNEFAEFDFFIPYEKFLSILEREAELTIDQHDEIIMTLFLLAYIIKHSSLEDHRYDMKYIGYIDDVRKIDLLRLYLYAYKHTTLSFGKNHITIKSASKQEVTLINDDDYVIYLFKTILREQLPEIKSIEEAEKELEILQQKKGGRPEELHHYFKPIAFGIYNLLNDCDIMKYRKSGKKIHLGEDMINFILEFARLLGIDRVNEKRIGYSSAVNTITRLLKEPNPRGLMD